VVAIEWIAREGSCTVFQAKIEDGDKLGMKLEHTLKLSDEDFRSLNGAPAALQAFRQGNQTEDEGDDGSCTFLEQLPSYIGSWLAQLLPRERILDFSCTRIDKNTQLPVHENDVAPQTART
jgi:hypothetical protein